MGAGGVWGLGFRGGGGGVGLLGFGVEGEYSLGFKSIKGFGSHSTLSWDHTQKHVFYRVRGIVLLGLHCVFEAWDEGFCKVLCELYNGGLTVRLQEV